jgi:hypothetical protein
MPLPGAASARTAIRIWGGRALPRLPGGARRRLARSILSRVAPGIEYFPDWMATTKAQFSFGWDFSPHLLSAGIWDDIRLVRIRAYIEDVGAHPLVNDRRRLRRLWRATACNRACAPNEHPSGEPRRLSLGRAIHRLAIRLYAPMITTSRGDGLGEGGGRGTRASHVFTASPSVCWMGEPAGRDQPGGREVARSPARQRRGVSR